MACHELKLLLEREVLDLQKEIIKDKYYESEKQGHDIGWHEAEKHYIHTHLKGWASGWKDCYCRNVCKDKDCPYHPKQ